MLVEVFRKDSQTYVLFNSKWSIWSDTCRPPRKQAELLNEPLLHKALLKIDPFGVRLARDAA